MHVRPSESLVASLNHAEILTRDLGRFLDFYCGVLGLEHVPTDNTTGMRHAIVRCGPSSWLHAVELSEAGFAHATALPLELRQLNHIALTATTPKAFMQLRRRLLACGATDGRTDDFGAFQTMSFSDPDGMRVELTLVIDPSLRDVRPPAMQAPVLPPPVTIERLCGRDRWPAIDSLLREYVPWVVERFDAEHGIRFDDPDAEMEKHHAAFAAETDAMLAGQGRLLLASLHGQAVGLVALKRIDSDSAEVKRLYVRPSARGHAIGRALLHRLLDDARADGFRVLRLETAAFMREAHALYEAFGFRYTGAFNDAQSAMSGLADIVRFMELRLRD